VTRREQLYPEIRRLREDEGLKWREIGERLGIPLKTACDYYHDPTGAITEARKAKNNGTCVEYGGETRNSGAKAAPERCMECFSPRWSQESIILALREWGEDHGGVPPRECDARLGFEGHGRLPYESSVVDRFGSWNKGLLAAGYATLNQDKRPETTQAMADAIRRGESAADIGERFGVSAAAVYVRLRYHGLAVSQLRSAA
jgi:hypothetical protein